MPDEDEPRVTFTTYNTGTATSYYMITWPLPPKTAAERIEDRVRAGEWPVQVLWDEWGGIDLLAGLRETELDDDVRGRCVAAVDTYLAQRALQAAMRGPITYRVAVLDLPEPPKAPEGFWTRLGVRLRAWAERAPGPRARR